MAAEEQRSWSSLPDDILPIIFKNLIDVDDILNCAAVSRSWRSVIRSLCHQLQLKPILLTPLLWSTGGFYEAGQLKNKNICFFFNTLTHKTHKLYLPQLEGTRSVFGSSYGWLLTIPHDGTQNTHLLNPFTRAQINLPPPGQGLGSGGQSFRVITSTDPSDPNCVFLGSKTYPFFLSGLNWKAGRMGFCRPGDSSWRKLEKFEGFCDDSIFYKGSFYAINDAYSMFRVSVSPLDGVATKLSVRTPEKRRIAYYKYLVEMNGDLLLVLRFRIYRDEDDPNWQQGNESVFKVYKLDWQRNRWTVEKNIGNNAILVGKSTSTSLVIDSTTANFKANCIYFINDSVDSGVGSYNMATEGVEWIYPY